MTVVAARIDQRLIHGIIVGPWAAKLSPKRFMVIDDVVSQDETIKESMRMTKPAGTGMSIINTEKALANFTAGQYDAQRVFVLTKEPSTIIKLLDAGIEIPELDLGIIFAQDGRTQISKFVSLNQTELADIKTIQSRGVPVFVQYVPNDTAVPFDEAIKGKTIA